MLPNNSEQIQYLIMIALITVVLKKFRVYRVYMVSQKVADYGDGEVHPGSSDVFG